MTRISYTNAKYLKHAGEMQNAQVSIPAAHKGEKIFIRDMEFPDFEKALRFLQRDSEAVFVTEERP